MFNLKLLTDLSFAFPDVLSICTLVTLIAIKILTGEELSKKLFLRISLLFAVVNLTATLVYTSFDVKINNGMFTYSHSLGQMKIMLQAALTCWLFYLSCTKLYKTLNADFFILTYGLINSITLALSANNFLVMFLALELYTFSLSLLVLNGQQNSETRKCVTRFLLTSTTMSAVFIFGCSLLYSQFGNLSFAATKLTNDFASIIGCSLIICSMLFKIGCFPFHTWLIDIYEKASSTIVLFLEAIWKPFLFFVFIRIVAIFLPGNFDQCKTILKAVSIMAMIVGSIIPIFQKNIQKFIASATIGHIGFLMVVPAAFTYTRSASVVMSYFVYYSLAILCFFTGILIVKRNRKIANFSDLTGIINTSPLIGFLILLSMFAMIGLPPFGNFIAKLNVFKFLLRHDAYLLLSVAVIYSIVSVFYVIKWSRFFFKPVKSDPIYNHEIILPVILLIALPVAIFFYDYINQHFMQILAARI